MEDEIDFNAALEDCKWVRDGIKSDEDFQNADFGLVMYYLNTIVQALEIATTVNREKWISCSEKMPPKRVAVLVYVIDNIHKIRFYAVAYLGRDIKNRKKNAWTFPTFPHQASSVQISSWMQYEVTHWMPLPEPPGGDDNG